MKTKQNVWSRQTNGSLICPNCGDDLSDGCCNTCNYFEPKPLHMTRKRMLLKKMLRK